MGPEVPANFQPPKPLPPLPEFIAKAIAAPKAGGVVRKIAVRPLIPEEQTWVTERAKQFQRTPEETAMLLAQANYVIRDAQRALEYERDHGRGGNRAWVRAAEEILDLKQRSDRLSWLDVRGTMMRAGELFTPVTDPVDLIHGLRTKFTWDELDPMFDDDKWGRKKLTEEIAKKLEARSPHPLAPSDKAKAVLYTLDFGKAGSGELPMEAQGWKLMPGANWDFARRQYDWDGGESGSQRPGALRIHSSGSQKNPLFNMPPKPGIPLAAKAGDYPGTALWFAAGAGDYEGRGRGGSGCYAHYDQSWVQVRQGDTRSFLIVAQVFTPDHTDEVGEPRGGWFYIRRPSRYISAGLRVVDAETRTVSLAPEQELLLKVEPALDRFDRVLLRVDITTQKQDGKRNTEGKNELKLAAYADGIGEVARATVDLNKARRGGAAALDTSDTGVAFAPAFGVRNSGDGFVPEFYLANLRVQQINDGPVEVIKGEPQPVPLAPKPAVASKAAAPVAPRTIQGPRSLVLAVDTSSSMAPMFDKARAALLETLGTLKPGERFALLDFCASVKPFAEDWTDVNPETLKRAAAWVQGLKVSSGTNTSGMLERALAYKGVNSIMIVTDGGAPNAGVTDAGQLLTFVRGKNASGARIDAVLVGQAPPDNLLARLAQENGGTTRTRQ